MEKILNKENCVAMVYHSDMWASYQCRKKGKILVDGKLYCGVHDPFAIREREARKEKIWQMNSCQNPKCHYHFDYAHYGFCPLCGTKRFFKKP